MNDKTLAVLFPSCHLILTPPLLIYLFFFYVELTALLH